MTGQSTLHISGLRSSVEHLHAAGRDAASLKLSGDVRAPVGQRALAPRDGGVWNTFGIGSRVTGGASPFGTISDAVFGSRAVFSGAPSRADGRIVTTLE